MRALTLTQPWAGLVASGIKLVENRPRPMIRREDFGKPFAIHASREIDESVYKRIYELAPELLGRASQNEDAARPRFSLGPDTSASWYRLSRITSAVIAIATIDDVIGGEPRAAVEQFLQPDQRRWYFGPVGYVLRDVRALATPVPRPGALGFWYLTPRDQRERGEVSEVERAVMEQVSGGCTLDDEGPE